MISMATTKYLRMFSINFILFYAYLVILSEVHGRLPYENEMKNLAAQMKTKLSSKGELASISNEDSYRRELDKYINSNEIQIIDINGQVLLDEMAKKLEKMLSRKMKALERSVKLAEDVAANYSYDRTLTKEEYVNTKDKSLINFLASEERFYNLEINSTMSAVHIPVEIYEGDIDILNGLEWTKDLDSIFKKNYEEDDEILWQYFGSQTGFMRTFPASLWKDPPNGVDLYDVRRRPWYTQGSSSPKDMLILIDTSGSVHGQSLQLMKVAVKSILDTLGENDFIRIANFSTEAAPIGCFKTFVQANYRNKKILSEAIDKLRAKGESSFTKAYEYAFQEFLKFENSSKEGVGARCNRIIMLLTDGGAENTEQVFEKYNWKGRNESERVRVFTYAVGQNPTPTSDIRWMACANRGRYSEIPAMGAIRAKVQEYVEVIARPLALNQVRRKLWTSSYSGSYGRSSEYVPVLARPAAIMNEKEFKWGNIYNDTLGLGMMTTVTLPVYNKTTNGRANQTILGVMGIDVTTDKMMQNSPNWQLGPNGYTFALNTNGYVIFHPQLVVKQHSEDPPSMDFLDIEIETEDKNKLRRNMIDGVAGTMNADSYIVSTDQQHLDKEKRVYFYTKIKDTSFSLGLSIPTYRMKQIVVKKTLDDALFSSLISELESENITAKLLSPWNYHADFNNMPNTTGSVENLIRDLRKGPTAFNWDEDRIKRLYLDLQITKAMFVSYLKVYTPKIKPNTSDSNDTIDNTPVAMFVGTYSGLTQVYPSEQADLLMPHRDTWNATYFRRALDSSLTIYSAPYTLVPRSENDTIPPIMIAKAVDITSRNIKEYVVGSFLHHNILLGVMDNISTTTSSVYRCSDTSSVYCYLLDDGAFLIATNQPELQTRIGQFFGKVDPNLMFEFDDKVYNKTVNYDYQATCTTDGSGTTSAAPLAFRIPSIYWLYEILTVGFWNNIWTWSVMNLNMFSWFVAPTIEAVATEEEERSCITKQAQYYFTEGLEPMSNTFHTNCNCTRDYSISRIDDTNLLFVMVSPKCTECPEVKNIIQEPQEDEGPDFCNMEPRYRKNPEKCFDFAAGEDTTQCSGPKSQPVPVLLIIIATILTILFTRVR